MKFIILGLTLVLATIVASRADIPQCYPECGELTLVMQPILGGSQWFLNPTLNYSCVPTKYGEGCYFCIELLIYKATNNVYQPWKLIYTKWYDAPPGAESSFTADCGDLDEYKTAVIGPIPLQGGSYMVRANAYASDLTNAKAGVAPVCSTIVRNLLIPIRTGP